MNKKKLIWQIPFLLLLVIGTVIILKQGQENINYQHDEGFIFGTVYHITYHSDTNLKKEIEAELKKVDESLSPFNKTSIISKVNRNENPVVNSMFTEVFLWQRTSPTRPTEPSILPLPHWSTNGDSVSRKVWNPTRRSSTT